MQTAVPLSWKCTIVLRLPMHIQIKTTKHSLVNSNFTYTNFNQYSYCVYLACCCVLHTHTHIHTHTHTHTHTSWLFEWYYTVGFYTYFIFSLVAPWQWPREGCNT